MSVRREIETAVARANPIDRATAADLLPDDVRGRFLEAVVLEPIDDPTRRRKGRRGSRGMVHRPTLRVAAIVLAICLVLASLTLFTAPGRAVSSWVGDQLGLGEPGGHPALQTLHHLSVRGTAGEGRPAYVLVRGPGPLDSHYELVTYRSGREPGGGPPLDGAHCFQVEFAEIRDLFGIGCGLPPARRGMIFQGPGGNSGPGMEFQYVSGLVSADVASVEVSVGGRPLPVRLTSIPTDLLERLRIRRPFRFFIAFAEPRFAGGAVTATARDAAGHVLVRRTHRIYDLGSALRPTPADQSGVPREKADGPAR